MEMKEDLYSMKEVLDMVEFLLRDGSTITNLISVHLDPERDGEKYILSFKY